MVISIVEMSKDSNECALEVKKLRAGWYASVKTLFLVLQLDGK